MFDQIFLRKQYDFPELRPLAVASILDGGANVGYSTIFLHSLFPDAHIVAVEPETRSFRQLELNVQLAGIEDLVTCVRGAIWPTRARLRVSDASEDAWAIRVEEHSHDHGGVGEADVRGYPLDELDTLSPQGHFDLMKLDIEGSERELFSAPEVRRALASVKAVLVELHDRVAPGSSEAFYRSIAPYHFNQYVRGDSFLVTLETGSARPGSDPP